MRKNKFKFKANFHFVNGKKKKNKHTNISLQTIIRLFIPVVIASLTTTTLITIIFVCLIAINNFNGDLGITFLQIK